MPDTSRKTKRGLSICAELWKKWQKKRETKEPLKWQQKILKSGKMTEEELAEMFKLTAKQLKAIKERVAVLA